MKHKLVILSPIFLVVCLLLGCSSGSEGPVSLPIPFEAALNETSRVVVADGVSSTTIASLTLQDQMSKEQSQDGCRNFPIFESTGTLTGSATYCTSSLITNLEVAGQRQDSFTAPVEVQIGSENTVSGTVQFFDYVHDDPTITAQLATLLPGEDLSGVEVRKGVCSGVVTDGAGTFRNAPGLATMDCRYVALSRVQNNRKAFLRMLESVWILHGANQVTPPGASAGVGILETMFENDRPIVGVPGGVGTELFCEGEEDACGFVEYTNLNIPTLNAELVEVFTSVEVCKRASEEEVCACSDMGLGCDCGENPSCVRINNGHFFENRIPQLADLLPDGVPFAATMTEHDPIVNCEEQATGIFLQPCLTGALNLDYRCEVVILFDENDNFVQFSRSLSGAYVIGVDE